MREAIATSAKPRASTDQRMTDEKSSIAIEPGGGARAGWTAAAARLGRGDCASIARRVARQRWIVLLLIESDGRQQQPAGRQPGPALAAGQEGADDKNRRGKQQQDDLGEQLVEGFNRHGQPPPPMRQQAGESGGCDRPSGGAAAGSLRSAARRPDNRCHWLTAAVESAGRRPASGRRRRRNLRIARRSPGPPDRAMRRIREVKKSGCTPIQTMNTINGAKANTSRSDKSRTDEGGSGLAPAMAVCIVAMSVVTAGDREPLGGRERCAERPGRDHDRPAGSRSGPKKTRSTSHSMYQAPSTTPKTATTAMIFNWVSSDGGSGIERPDEHSLQDGKLAGESVQPRQADAGKREHRPT